MIDTFRLEDVQRSPAFFDIKKCSHINGVYIRALSTEDFIDITRPWVNPNRDEWAPGNWHDPDAAASESAGPPWPAENFDADIFARMAPVVQERVTLLGEVPAMVDFLFQADPVIDQDSWDKAIAKDDARQGSASGCPRRVRHLRMDSRRTASGHPGTRRDNRSGPGQGAGTDPGGGHREASGPTALRVTRGTGT